ncbi:MAG: hypothetical protein WBW94_15745 [Anaerolineales bacterium]
MEQIQKKIPVKGTFSEIKGWLQDWHSPNGKSHFLHSMTLEDGMQKIYWNVSNKPADISEVSFIFEYKETGFLLVTFQYFDDEDIKPDAEILLKEFENAWGTHIPPLGFHAIVSKPELAALLEERWAESERAIRADAYLSSTVLLGSILEGVLIDVCYRFPQIAGNAKSKMTDGRGKSLPFEEWHLESLINVAYECKWITLHAKEQSKSLRLYRNIIHPKEQLKLDFYPNQDTCSLSQNVLRVAMKDIFEWIKKQTKTVP